MKLLGFLSWKQRAAESEGSGTKQKNCKGGRVEETYMTQDNQKHQLKPCNCKVQDIQFILLIQELTIDAILYSKYR